jgi:hypothetical protein
MFLKRMSKIHHKGQEALDQYRKRQQRGTDDLITLLHDLVAALQQDGTAQHRLATMHERLGDQTEQILAQCQAHTAYSDNNYFSLLWRFYQSHRQALFAFLEEVDLASTSQDTTVKQAVDFLYVHRKSKRDWLDLDPEQPLNLAWVSDKWWKLVTGSTRRNSVPTQLDRRHFEVCVFSQIMAELKSGDLCIEGSDKFADYRDQLISWAEYEQGVDSYGTQIKKPVDPHAFVDHLRANLERVATETDACFPDNESVRIENGEPILKQVEKRKEPEALKRLEQAIAERIEPVNILDVLVDTERWIGWTQSFGPVSGHQAKIEQTQARYVAAAFCYGCNLGPSQTAGSLESVDRRQIAWVNQRPCHGGKAGCRDYGRHQCLQSLCAA